ncbi:MAG: sugar phosphate isomerase/epimerase family protein [Spirochaetota bacterium]|nr:sugar phosphate isomerase/epimerase family protein [Spirochaetota bacterium]
MCKLSVITGFLGRIANRFLQYTENQGFTDKVKMAAQIEGLDGLELCYPADFEDVQSTKKLLDDYGLGVSSINFRSRRTGKWWRGSFTSEITGERREVVDNFKRVVDIADELGCGKVTTCPLNEGSDYLFEMDYEKAYGYFEESIREVAEYKPEIRICLEYKQSDPRARTMLGTAGETIAFCEQVGMPNVGLTLDIGHSLYAHERPSQALVLAQRSKRLFHVHLNDNDKQWDWDMLPGAYNLWDFVEFFYYLKRTEYSDWCAFDIFPKEIDRVETFNQAIRFTRKLIEIADRIDEGEMQQLLAERNPTKSLEYVFSLIK